MIKHSNVWDLSGWDYCFPISCSEYSTLQTISMVNIWWNRFNRWPAVETRNQCVIEKYNWFLHTMGVYHFSYFVIGRAHSYEKQNQNKKSIVRSTRPFDVLIGKLLFESNIRHLMNYENNQKISLNVDDDMVESVLSHTHARLTRCWLEQMKRNLIFAFNRHFRISVFGEQTEKWSTWNSFASFRVRCKNLLQTDQWFPIFAFANTKIGSNESEQGKRALSLSTLYRMVWMIDSRHKWEQTDEQKM